MVNVELRHVTGFYGPQAGGRYRGLTARWCSRLGFGPRRLVRA
jgi:hypothetical protein